MTTRKILTAVIFSLIIFALPVKAADDITVYVNGSIIESSNKPVIQNNTTLVPMRDVAEAMGAAVAWNSSFKQVKIQMNDTLVTMYIGDFNIRKFSETKSEDQTESNPASEQTISSSVAPQIINGSTYIPLRIMAEAFDAEVEWDGETKTIYITSDTSNTSSENIIYTLDGDTIIISGKGAMEDYRYDESPISEYKNAKKIIIEYGITHIGDYAFQDCYNVTNIEIPDSVTSIGKEAFSSCNDLKSIEIPSNVVSIGSEAFSWCKELKSIEIPSSVVSIGNLAFEYCVNLESINVNEGNRNYTSLDGVLYNKDKTALVACPAAKTSIEIPSSVTSISYGAFYYCNNLTSVVIPNGVTSISGHTFAYCYYLESIELPNSLTKIDEFAFFACDSLTSVKIPDSVESIGEDAFYSCDGLTSIEIPSSVTQIDETAFEDCNNLARIKCKKGSAADDASLYPVEVTFIYQ